ncbi:hypothetical protein GO986_22255 [Deinococcus sp. HMF7620]|uniref:PKD domain-containing protein n=1 Tax=Deinococcus arboris TaxID=2682977 RepID=A0A7C9LTZ2_9DEIO|nr:hypothetical protein [Deinococcus arboris]MVN89461.1 hypothetical protein [Deinococcus arboris]
MKRFALLLPLLLAACGTTSAPQLNAQPSIAGVDYVASFEATVLRDLQNLGLTSDLSAQAVASKSYLNVLKLTDSSARAYVKTTYPAATACTVNWGDGKTESVLTPTPADVSTEKKDHSYTSSGTFTITLTCGTDVKTAAFTAVIPVPASRNLFDSLTFQYRSGYSNTFYQYLGRTVTTDLGLRLETSDNNHYLVENNASGFKVFPDGHKAIAGYLTAGPMRIRTENGNTFNVASISAGNWESAEPTTLTAYGVSGNVIGTTTFSNSAANQQPVATNTVTWNNVSYISIAGTNQYKHFFVDDLGFTIN